MSCVLAQNGVTLWLTHIVIGSCDVGYRHVELMKMCVVSNLAQQ